jgi:hypothetical protein
VKPKAVGLAMSVLFPNLAVKQGTKNSDLAHDGSCKVSAVPPCLTRLFICEEMAIVANHSSPIIINLNLLIQSSALVFFSMVGATIIG